MGWIAAVVFDGVISRLGPLVVSGAIHTVLVLTVIAGYQALGPRALAPRVTWMSLEPPTVPPTPEPPKHRPSIARAATTPTPESTQREPASLPPRSETRSAEATPPPAPTVLPSAPATPSTITSASAPPEATPRRSVSSTPEAPASVTAPVIERESVDATMAVPRHVVRDESAGQELSNGLGPSARGKSAGTAIAALPPSESPGGGIRRQAELRGGYQVRPSYPRAARQRGIQGTTLLRVHVDTDGRVGDIIVQESAGHAELDGAAVHAVRQWRFQPARNDAGPVAMWVLIPVEFRLTDAR